MAAIQARGPRDDKKGMKTLALVGLVVSLVLGAIAVSSTNDEVHARQNAQDASLLGAVSTESGLISEGERQTTTALSLMLVNPAVRRVLSAHPTAPAQHAQDLVDAQLALTTIRRTAFVPVSAACLDDGGGRQLVCSPPERTGTFSPQLGHQFVALAAGSAVGAASGAFFSPISHQLSVAFLAPFRVGRRLLGLVHLDINVANTRGSGLIVNDTPGVEVLLAGYANGQLLLNSPSSQLSSSGLGSPTMIATTGLGRRPQPMSDRGHRALAATLPLTVTVGKQQVAVVATAKAPNPGLFNSWNTGMLAVLALAFLTLIGSVIGLVVSHRSVRRELSTDPLTRLRNRRALMVDLPRVCQSASEDRPAFLWFFDLNGFKRYNDSFGHVAGDTLLARLGGRLRDTINPHGRVYRLGGDEFCVLITAPVPDPHALFQRACTSLTERGGGFTVSASAGAVELPREASEPTQALRLADQRMYRQKATSQTGAAELITSVLHAALAQRHPDLGEHSDDVAGDVELLARTIGMNDDAIDLVMKAGNLHDVGKLGIPDEIVTKPGPLSDQEWEFMRQHTVIGEQIIAAAGPSLERIGPLVRASHERWDGTGYPDGLAGEEIPLGARIIVVCDSFHAMMDERVYKPAMSLPDALAELRRCAGSQFDPQLVEVFCRLVTERTSPERLRAGARSL
ncbi:MAG TPA: diguanylate cyclase [Solirubrobacteraceae bacterium]|nr:diguanylate cyclase [Solirubrobacteraceae bacterium]